MNQRSKEIIIQLLEFNRQSLKEISEMYEVSERTIRNDVASLDEYLKSCGFGTVEVKNKKIVLNLVVPKEEILHELNKFNVYDYKFSREERSIICLLILINHREYVTLNQLSDKLLASRSTIVNDMKNMRDIAKENNLKIISKANKGYKVNACESDIRLFLFKVFTQEHFKVLESIFFEENYKQLIRIDLLERDLVIIKDELNPSAKFLDDFYRYMIISSYRNYKSFKLEHNYELKKSKGINRNLGKLTYPYLFDEDYAFIYHSLLENQSNPELNAKLNRDAILVQVTTMKFIERISTDLAVDFKNDYTFYENFSAHLLRMFKNEYINDKRKIDLSIISSSHIPLKECVLNNLSIIEENIGRKVTEIEADYILIHVYAALERKKRIGGDLKVAVLTKEKASEVFLIESKLVNHFAFNLDIYSIDDTILGNYDLILTTTPLANKNYIYISPSITDEDYIVIAQFVNEIVKQKETKQISLTKEYANQIFELVSEVIDRDLSKDKTKEIIMQKLSETITEEKTVNDKLLQAYLTSDRIKLEVDATDWRDSIYQAGELLVRNNEITEEYLDIIISNIEKNGPYVIISKGFAFPHAQLGEYNKKTSMNLIRLAHPIYFDDENQEDENDISTLPVKYVCILSAVDKQQHLKAVFNLFNLLKDPHFKESLDQCTTSQQVHNLIKNSETLLELRR